MRVGRTVTSNIADCSGAHLQALLIVSLIASARRRASDSARRAASMRADFHRHAISDDRSLSTRRSAGLP
jgi:hypothetical protein